MLGNNLPLKAIMPDTANMTIPVIGNVGDIHADTILLSWACMGFILLAAGIIGASMKPAGGGTGQSVLEMLYEFVADLTKGQIGDHDWKKFFPLIAAIFIFVLTANFSGVLPWKALETMPWWPYKVVTHDATTHKEIVSWKLREQLPNTEKKHAVENALKEDATTPETTENPEVEAFELAAPSTDFNVTAGLAMVALLTYLGAGFAAHKAHYLKLYINPIEWLDLVIRPSTLALRLMMVITADELMRGAALMMVPFFLPAGVMGFELFIGVIQAFVFALLTAIYIGLTVSHH
jgi:F-type H+-transporting ATPase subunit a